MDARDRVNIHFVEKVVKAWTETGPQPRYHEEAKIRLRRSWPILGRALDELAKDWEVNG